jgi:hypothetical protein
MWLVVTSQLRFFNFPSLANHSSPIIVQPAHNLAAGTVDFTS